MRVAFVTATALAAIFATAAAADDYPPRKAGLWEVAVHNQSVPNITMKMCIDAETDQLFHKFSGDIRSKHCGKNDTKTVGNVVTSESDCTIGGTKVDSVAVATFTGDSAYHVDIKTHFDPPKLGHSDLAMSQDAKWVSECPADMKPGDFEMGHGIKINIKTIERLRSLLPGHSDE